MVQQVLPPSGKFAVDRRQLHFCRLFWHIARRSPSLGSLTPTSIGVAMAESYDERKELYRYVSCYKHELMTPIECRAERLGMLREKARASDSEAVRNMFMADYEAEADEELLRLIGDDLDGVRAFQARVAARIESEIADGRMTINRCPNCNRVVRTPRARQCLWCGHDWHGTD